VRAIRHRLAAAALAAVVVAAGAAALAGTASAESNGGVRVMPLGDSITDGFTVPGGYRIGLWQRLVAANYTVDFVGSLSNGPSTLGDHDHEGHSGWRIDQIDANIVSWLQATTPHTILLHIGTNDVLQNLNLATAPQRLSTLLDHIIATAPTAEVFVATIIPLSNAAQEANVRTFNAAIPGIVQTKAAGGAHVHLVDMHAALTAADLADGIHPNATGYDKMAAVWYSALQSVSGSIGSPGGSSPSPSVTRSPSPSAGASSPAGGARSCTAAYRVVGQWPGGFQGSVTVTAGGSAITSWRVTWTLASGQSISSFWNTTISTAASAVTATNVSYNGTIGSGASTEFGFLGTWSGVNGTPVLSCTAG
jgi:lysophospholipase L1-like esterase